MPADEEMVAFRLAEKDRKAVKHLIDSGEFRNRSDFFRYAVKTTLERLEDKPRMDLDLDAVELPTQASSRGKARARRSSRGVNL